MSQHNTLQVRDVLVGLAASVLRDRRHEGAVLAITPLWTVAFVDPSTCPGDGIGGSYCIGGHSWPTAGFRRMGDIDVWVVRR